MVMLYLNRTKVCRPRYLKEWMYVVSGIVNPNGHLGERVREGARPEGVHCVHMYFGKNFSSSILQKMTPFLSHTTLPEGVHVCIFSAYQNPNSHFSERFGRERGRGGPHCLCANPTVHLS